MQYPLKEVIKEATDKLLCENISDAPTDVWLLAEHVLSIDKQQYYLHPEMEIDEEQYKKYMLAIEQRREHIPLQHITGSQEFMGLDFKVNENVLIPRQDTEELVLKTIEAVECLNKDKKETIRVLDMCTGSGCIAVSIAKLCENVKTDAVDLSQKALEVAKENAEINKADVRFIKSDMFDNITDKYDVIVSNPPYIRSKVIEGLESEVKDHEPRMALDGDEDGLKFYRIIVEQAREFLRSDGVLLFEIGYDQGDDLRGLLDSDYKYVKVYKDLAGLDRVVVATNNDRVNI